MSYLKGYENSNDTFLSQIFLSIISVLIFLIINKTSPKENKVLYSNKRKHVSIIHTFKQFRLNTNLNILSQTWSFNDRLVEKHYQKKNRNCLKQKNRKSFKIVNETSIFDIKDEKSN